MATLNEVINQLISKLDTLITESDPERLLLASQCVIPLKEALSLDLSESALQKEMGLITITGNPSYKDFKPMINAAFAKVGYLTDKIKLPADYLLLTKILTDIAKNSAAFILTYVEGRLQQNLIEEIRTEYNVRLTNLLEVMVARVSIINNSEDAVLAANAVSNMLQLNLETGNYNKMIKTTNELNDSIRCVATQTRDSNTNTQITLSNIFKQISNDLQRHISAKNPHGVDKEQLELNLVPNYPATTDVENDSSTALVTASVTKKIWEEVKKPKIEDAPSDGKYYVRKDSKWVEGLEGVPIGTILPYSGKIPPMGWLWLEDETVYTKFEYPKLYNHLKKNCAHLIINDDTFKLCSSEGMFFRGHNPKGTVDPDGVGRTLLTEQEDATRNITSGIYTGDSYDLDVSLGNSNSTRKSLYTEDGKRVGWKIISETEEEHVDSDIENWVYQDIPKPIATFAENRPKNLNCLWIIKAYNSISNPAILQTEEIINKINKNTSDINTKILRENILINGDFQIWQRGEYFRSGDWVADRWWASFHQEGIAKSDTDAPKGYSKSLYLKSPQITFGQAIEIPKKGTEIYLPENTLTLSGWYRGNFDGNLYISLKYRNSKFITDNERIFDTINNGFITSSEAWRKFQITFSSNGINDSNTLLLLETDDINGWLKITGLKLEKGSKATPFVADDVSLSLMKCQRYYETCNGITQACPTNSFNDTIINYKVNKRILPTLTFLKNDRINNDFVFNKFINTTVVNTGIRFTCTNVNAGYNYDFTVSVDAEL